MKGYNRMQIMGNLTDRPELRTAGERKTPVANFTVAVNSGRDDTLYIDCEAWSGMAETLHEFLRKGSPLFVAGTTLRPYAYISRQDDEPRAKMKLRVEEFRFIGGGQEQRRR